MFQYLLEMAIQENKSSLKDMRHNAVEQPVTSIFPGLWTIECKAQAPCRLRAFNYAIARSSEVRMINETHNLILELRADRLTYAAIAQKLGLSLRTVAGVCQEYAPQPSDRPVPAEMSLLTARDIHQVTGLWPLTETAPAISKRAMEIMKGRRRKHTMPELGKWLENLGLVP